MQITELRDAHTRELANLRASHAAELADLRAALAEAERRRQELEKEASEDTDTAYELERTRDALREAHAVATELKQVVGC